MTSLSENKIASALDTFFCYAQSRERSRENPPEEVQRSFQAIIDYYTPLLRNYLTIKPCDKLYRHLSEEDLFQETWATFWIKGYQINQQSSRYVYLWLKSITISLRKRSYLNARKVSVTEVLDAVGSETQTLIYQAWKTLRCTLINLLPASINKFILAACRQHFS